MGHIAQCLALGGPRFERLGRDAAPMRHGQGFTARVYSGASGSLRVPSRTNLPLTIVDVSLAPHTVFHQDLPATDAGFVYPLEGTVFAGRLERRRVTTGQIGWLSTGDGSATTRLELRTGDHPARVMLYAGQRQHVPIVTHGPFVGETRADLVRVSQAYVDGRMPRLSTLAAAQS